MAAAAASSAETGTAGETLIAGQAIYLDTSDSNKVKLADADNLASAKARGVTLGGAASGQPVKYLTSGLLNPGATVVVGEAYVVSVTAGGIGIHSELASTDFITILGVGTTTAQIKVLINVSGKAKA